MADHHLPSGYADTLQSTSSELKRTVLSALASGFVRADSSGQVAA